MVNNRNSLSLNGIGYLYDLGLKNTKNNLIIMISEFSLFWVTVD